MDLRDIHHFLVEDQKKLQMLVVCPYSCFQNCRAAAGKRDQRANLISIKL